MKKSNRGGRRPGAGAPRGNLNALKHGRRSRQFAQLGALLAANPTTREALLDLARRHFDKQLKVEEAAAELFARLFEHAHDIARGVPSPGPFARYLGSNVQPQRQNVPQSTADTPEYLASLLQTGTTTARQEKSPPHQSSAGHKPAEQPSARYENRPPNP